MHGRLLVAVVVLAAAALAVAAPAGAVGAHGGAGGGPAVADAPTCGVTAANVTSVETQGVDRANATGVVLEGKARVDDFQPVTGWFEYRRVGATEWRATGRTTDEPNACGGVWFEAPVGGLDRNGTYEFRVVVTTGNDTARGNVTRFEPRVPTATATPDGDRTTDTPVTQTPDPCPSFRGAAGLCTTTPTPTPTPAAEDVAVDVPDEEESSDDWLGGLVPVLAWVALVAVLAPLVLGGLVGLDSLRGDGG